MAQQDEAAFRRWYAEQSQRYGLSPDPEGQSYDYRAAFKAGAKPDASGHWPSDFKQAGHPNEVVGGFNTRTGERVPGTTRANESELVRMGWDAPSAKRLAAMPEQQQPEKVIQIPGVGNIAFPSHMTPDQINQAAARLYREKNPNHPPPAKEHSWLDTATDWLPAAGGALGGVVGGFGGTVGGFGVGGVPGAVGGAALGGGAGEATKQLVNRWRGRPAPSSATEAATGIAGQAALQGGTEAVGGAVAPLLKHGAGVLMQAAVKPGLAATTRAVARGVPRSNLPIIKTLLNEGVNVTPGGIAKLDRIINSTNKQIADAVASVPGSVDPAKVATRTQEVAGRLAQQVDPMDDVSAVQRVTENFLSQPGTTAVGQIGTKSVPTGVLDASGMMVSHQVPVMGRVPRALSLPEAQAMKTGTYRTMKDRAYGEMKGPAIEANKALARGLKEEIEVEAKKAGMDLGALNAREGAAISAKEAIAKRVAAAGNRDPISLAWLAANPTAGLLFVMERSPVVKSMLARGLYQSAARASKVPENVLRLLVSSVATQQDEGAGGQ